ncbi:hypothetical protein ACES2J_08240 [Bdellovibrio bacteriovorus]|uniref:hypothetical protein n=1 Tax=Bdellovibrio bacteriovorus TaxID=959 RepID=UPI0035A5C551
MSKRTNWDEQNPDLKHLNPYTDLIEQHKEDPIVKALLGEFFTAFEEYAGYQVTTEYIEAAAFGFSGKIQAYYNDRKDEMFNTLTRIQTRVDEIEETKFSRNMTSKTYWASMVAAIAAIAGAVIGLFKG